MATWNHSRYSGAVTPALTRIERSPEQPSVKFGLVGLADFLEAAPDQRLDRGVGPGDRGKDLACAIHCLDVAEADFEMPLAVLAAADIG